MRNRSPYPLSFKIALVLLGFIFVLYVFLVLPSKSSVMEEEVKRLTNISSDVPTIECECPRCGSKHMMKLLWIGRGVPKKFCISCKNTVDKLSQDEINGHPVKGYTDWRFG